MDATKINKLVKDMYNILRDGGTFSVTWINGQLEEKGWEPKTVNDYIVELVLAILEKEFKFSVSSHTVHGTFNHQVQHLSYYRIPHKASSSQVFFLAVSLKGIQFS